MELEIKNLRHGKRLRKVNPKILAVLVENIKVNGLQLPILVERDLRTIADGVYRVEACKQLGFNTIQAIVVDKDPQQDIAKRVLAELLD